MRVYQPTEEKVIILQLPDDAQECKRLVPESLLEKRLLATAVIAANRSPSLELLVRDSQGNPSMAGLIALDRLDFDDLGIALCTASVSPIEFDPINHLADTQLITIRFWVEIDYLDVVISARWEIDSPLSPSEKQSGYLPHIPQLFVG